MTPDERTFPVFGEIGRVSMNGEGKDSPGLAAFRIIDAELMDGDEGRFSFTLPSGLSVVVHATPDPPSPL